MAYIKNLDPNGARILTDHGIAVESGEWAELPDEDAERLAEQSVWEVVHPDGAPVKAANARAEQVAEEEAQAAGVDLPLSGEPDEVSEPRRTRKTKTAEEAK